MKHLFPMMRYVIIITCIIIIILLFFDWVLFPCRLIPHIKGNVGFVFTKEDLADVRDLILANKVAAPAKAGALAPIDVFVPKGNTGLGPEKTSFFQALAIPTKIAKGTIEILVSMCFCCCAVKLRALSKVRTGRLDYGWIGHFGNEIGFFQEFLLKNHLFCAY